MNPLNAKQIIMNFSTPPSLEDVEVMASGVIDTLPEEITELCDDISLQVEDVADEAVEQEFDLDDPFDLLVLYRSGKEISPGVESKVANDDDVLIVYRRPILDMWCETGDDLGVLIRQMIIEELARRYDFSDDDIDDMVERHYQGLL